MNDAPRRRKIRQKKSSAAPKAATYPNWPNSKTIKSNCGRRRFLGRNKGMAAGGATGMGIPSKSRRMGSPRSQTSRGATTGNKAIIRTRKASGINVKPGNNRKPEATEINMIRQDETESPRKTSGAMGKVSGVKGSRAVSGAKGSRAVSGVKDSKAVSGAKDSRAVSGVKDSRAVSGAKDTKDSRADSGVKDSRTVSGAKDSRAVSGV
ncbi:MAG: hypothetical protein LBB94_03700, partial [Clostridiales bacterium]|nr:hypothetical protein [Clostridiales bacterium]